MQLGSPPGVTTDTLPSWDSAQRSDFIRSLFSAGFSAQHVSPSVTETPAVLGGFFGSGQGFFFFQALGLGVDLTGWVKLGKGAPQVWLKCTENMHLVVQSRVATEAVRGRKEERK